MQKILIANRGEIACRIIRTARDLGYRTVAVYSEPDRDALHVTLADQAVCIGPANVSYSYLNSAAIIDAAERSGADAIHPGYGFLSENADFARACELAGMTFIGPPPSAIRLMGSKRAAKQAMLEAGVPCVPGYQGEDQADETLVAEARKIGPPLMIKASAGGGGRGMRLVTDVRELAEQIRSARSEAKSAFGSDELILERAVVEPRHIEIQVFADTHGNVVHLGERDCSIQRRHQKVVEEAPSPFVDEPLREKMGEAAVAAARACHYVGAGTVEFLVDRDKNFYFLEMNTRLQVEHPVTEFITGQDLVAWQFTVAEGEALPLTQKGIVLRGHAVEVRLYAEDPRNNFMPQTGRVRRWYIPERAGCRVDDGIREGQMVSPHYDPMLAKLIARGKSRPEAIRRLASLIQDMEFLGLNHNGHFLRNVLHHPAFVAGEATTAFIDQHLGEDITLRTGAPAAAVLARAALIYFQQGVQHSAAGFDWHRVSPPSYVYHLEVEGELHTVALEKRNGRYGFTVDTINLELELIVLDERHCTVIADGVRETFPYVLNGSQLWLDHGSGHYAFEDVTHRPAAAGVVAGGGEIKASMDGSIVDVRVAVGDQVEAGQTLIVLEAMKMEHPLKAGVSGVVSELTCGKGDQVKSRQRLAVIESE